MSELRQVVVRRAAAALGYAPRHVFQATWRYLDEQFPPPQALSIALTPIVSYLLYGRIAGHLSFDGNCLAAAALVVVLFLQYRLVDDVCTYYNDELGGPSVIPVKPKPLMLAVVATIPLLFVLEPHPRPLLVALAALAAMSACAFVLAIGGRLPISRYVVQVPFIELVPLMIFAYVYFAWSTATGRHLSAVQVIAVIGTVWTAFQFWKWSRHLGDDPLERIYRLSWSTVRAILVTILALAAAFQALLYVKADLSAAFLAWAIAQSLFFGALVWPRGQRDERRPWWAGLAFPTALLGGLYVQLLALA